MTEFFVRCGEQTGVLFFLFFFLYRLCEVMPHQLLSS